MTGLLSFELSRIGNVQSFNFFKCFGVFCRIHCQKLLTNYMYNAKIVFFCFLCTCIKSLMKINRG